jgi:hypothetical protein
MGCMSDATAVLDQLDSQALARRLDELEAERRAVLILLRAARARERGLPPVAPGPAVPAKGGRRG